MYSCENTRSNIPFIFWEKKLVESITTLLFKFVSTLFYYNYKESVFQTSSLKSNFCSIFQILIKF